MGYFEEYDGIIKGWHEEGIIEIAPNNTDTGHYLSHQAVIKDSSLTTKVRPVFDASLKDENGNSLNACLEKGPNLIEMLPKLLIQFRQHAIGVTADIRKAFLQISLCVRDRDFFEIPVVERFKQNRDCYLHTLSCRVRHFFESIPVGSNDFLTFR
ncbi:uncharacterized protein LOC118187002 [Stegodyphus dumicola]|uniref:uncharacterized protein LOC118187002 n=1 Tax=Stegodyphus dumicola TaxID=202533 RepID=UPI0015AD0A2B|nr:uncharacterized protein LOC118187002 [Stegodyphus dumicola]